MPKSEWTRKKEEMKLIKREIANLCPATMFASIQNKRQEEFEENTLLRVKYPSLKKLTKQ